MNTQQTAHTFSRVVAVAAVLFIAIAVFEMSPYSHVEAQNAGVVGIQAQEVAVFAGQFSTTTHSKTLNDQGQALNILFFCGTNFGFTGSIDLEWTPSPATPASTYYVLASASYTNLFSNCHAMQVGGYWPNLRATITPNGTGVLNVWYTSSAGPVAYTAPAINSNGATSPVSCDHSTSALYPTGTTTLVVAPINTSSDTVVICGDSFSWATAPTGGSISLAWGTTPLCGNLDSANWILATPATIPLYIPNPQGLRTTNFSKQYLCLINSSGQSVQANFSYASVQIP